MELSKRLYAVAGLVTEGASVADIGTDHGYIPIYLIEKKIARRAIALDINKGPLKRAESHIAKYGLEEQIETRLSDGLKALRPGEADTVIAAGMGGPLIIKILEEGENILDTFSSFILQPQSEAGKVRRYLNGRGMRIVCEDMVEEDGKYYPLMKAVRGMEEPYEEWEYLYGKRLLEGRHPVLFEYLLRREQIVEGILKQLRRAHDSGRRKERISELQTEADYIKEAQRCLREVKP